MVCARDARSGDLPADAAHQTELRQIVGLLLEQETVDCAAVYAVLGMPVPEHGLDGTSLAPHLPAPVASRAVPGPAVAGAAGSPELP
jgi:hypothetical protein